MTTIGTNTLLTADHWRQLADGTDNLVTELEVAEALQASCREPLGVIYSLLRKQGYSGLLNRLKKAVRMTNEAIEHA